MAGSQKEFELLFKLKATLGGDFKNTFKQAIDTQKQLQNSLKNVNSIQSKIDGFTKQSAAIDKNKQKLEALNAEHDRLQRELNESGEPTEALRKKLERNESQIQQTTARIEEQERQLDALGNELREAGVNTGNLADENERLQKSYDNLKSSQERLQRLNEEQQKVKESIGQTKAQLAGTLEVIGGVAAAVYAGPVKAAMDYETALAKVGTIADGTKVPMETMSKEIMALSNSTGIAATALADDVYNAISAGQDTADAVNFVTYSTKLAKAGFAESAQTLDVLTTILNAYGLEADEVGRVSDMLIQTQNKGKVTVAELSSVMGKIIPTAKSNGVALEQITAGYAIMTSKGIAAAETTTYMNSMLNELGKSGTTADKALRAAAGKGFKELMAEGKSLSEVLNILQEDAAKGGKSLADVFGSAEAGKAAVTLLSDGVAGFNTQVENMRAASDGIGATQIAFELMEQTTEAKMQKAQNSIKNLMTVIGQTFLPMVGEIAEAITPVITKISEFAQENPKLVATVAKVVAGLAAARVGFLGLKLAGLSGESGIISIIQKLVGLRAGMIENAATSVSFAKRISGAGKGLLSYFGNVGKALGGVGSAIGNIFSGNAIIGKVKGFLGGIGSRLMGGITGLAGKAAGALTGAGSKMLGYILTPFKAIGGRLGGLLSGMGSVIANSPLGKIGSIITGGISKAFGAVGSLFAPIGNAVKSILGPIGTLAKTALGPLGGIAGKMLPIVGVVTAVITVFKLVKEHLQEIRGFIQKTFGDEALAVFDKVVAIITSVGETIKNVFSDGNIGAARDKIQEIFGDKGAAVFDKLVGILQSVIGVVQQLVGFITENVVPVAEQILQVIVGQVIPGIVSFIQAAAPTIMTIIQSVVDFVGAVIPIIADAIAGLMPVISEIIGFISTYVLPIIQDVFNFITSTVLPVISQMVQALLPVIQNVLQTLIPAIQTAVTTIWNVVSPIIQGILAAVQAAMPTIQAVVTTVVNAIGGVINGLATVLNGIITFITGVFTGNWRQAWDGIKSIFSGIWEAIKSVAKGAVNGIISIINGIIGGLNKLKIPDWVPGLGGKGINIPLIPMLAKGSRNTPDTFIAGEAGPELITNAPGRTVFTAAQTKDIMAAQGAVSAAAAAAPTVGGAGVQTASTVNAAPTVAAGAGVTNNDRTNHVEIHNSPTIVVNGDQPGDLEAKLEENNQKLLKQVENLLDDKADKEERQRYD